MNKTPIRLLITLGLVIVFAVLERRTGPLHDYRHAALAEPAVFLAAAAVVCRSTRSMSARAGLALLTLAAAWNLYLLDTKAGHVMVLFAGAGSANPTQWGPHGELQALAAIAGAIMVILAPTRPRPVPAGDSRPPEADNRHDREQPELTAPRYTEPPRRPEPVPYRTSAEVVEPPRRDIPAGVVRISPPARQAIMPARHRKTRR